MAAIDGKLGQVLADPLGIVKEGVAAQIAPIRALAVGGCATAAALILSPSDAE